MEKQPFNRNQSWKVPYAIFYNRAFANVQVCFPELGKTKETKEVKLGDIIKCVETLIDTKLRYDEDYNLNPETRGKYEEPEICKKKRELLENHFSFLKLFTENQRLINFNKFLNVFVNYRNYFSHGYHEKTDEKGTNYLTIATIRKDLEIIIESAFFNSNLSNSDKMSLSNELYDLENMDCLFRTGHLFLGSLFLNEFVSQIYRDNKENVIDFFLAFTSKKGRSLFRDMQEEYLRFWDIIHYLNLKPEHLQTEMDDRKICRNNNKLMLYAVRWLKENFFIVEDENCYLKFNTETVKAPTDEEPDRKKERLVIFNNNINFKIKKSEVLPEIQSVIGWRELAQLVYFCLDKEPESNDIIAGIYDYLVNKDNRLKTHIKEKSIGDSGKKEIPKSVKLYVSGESINEQLKNEIKARIQFLKNETQKLKTDEISKHRKAIGIAQYINHIVYWKNLDNILITGNYESDDNILQDLGMNSNLFKWFVQRLSIYEITKEEIIQRLIKEPIFNKVDFKIFEKSRNLEELAYNVANSWNSILDAYNPAAKNDTDLKRMALILRIKYKSRLVNDGPKLIPIIPLKGFINQFQTDEKRHLTRDIVASDDKKYLHSDFYNLEQTGFSNLTNKKLNRKIYDLLVQDIVLYKIAIKYLKTIEVELEADLTVDEIYNKGNVKIDLGKKFILKINIKDLYTLGRLEHPNRMKNIAKSLNNNGGEFYYHKMKNHWEQYYLPNQWNFIDAVLNFEGKCQIKLKEDGNWEDFKKANLKTNRIEFKSFLDFRKITKQKEALSKLRSNFFHSGTWDSDCFNRKIVQEYIDLLK
ncbi:hypothetical protein ACFLSQ_05355 [Bacteroidota bacterium]